MNQNNEFTFTQMGVEGLDLVEPLWLKLNEHHKERSQHFRDHFEHMTWEARKKDLLEKTKNGLIHVDIAREQEVMIGYCISSIYGEKTGEIESIFVKKERRHFDIGEIFMQNAVQWMNSHKANRKMIGVAAGNEEVFGFYARFGFFPRTHILVQVDNK